MIPASTGTNPLPTSTILYAAVMRPQCAQWCGAIFRPRHLWVTCHHIVQAPTCPPMDQCLLSLPWPSWVCFKTSAGHEVLSQNPVLIDVVSSLPRITWSYIGPPALDAHVRTKFRLRQPPMPIVDEFELTNFTSKLKFWCIFCRLWGITFSFVPHKCEAHDMEGSNVEGSTVLIDLDIGHQSISPGLP